MSDLARAPELQRQPMLLIAACIALAAAALWFVSQTLHYLTNSLALYMDYFWGRRVGLLAHLVGGITAICAGLVRIWLIFGNRAGRLHRLLGRAYVGAIRLAYPAGVYLGLTIPHHFVYASGLFFLAAAWTVTTASLSWTCNWPVTPYYGWDGAQR